MNIEDRLRRIFDEPPWKPGQPYEFRDPKVYGAHPKFWPGFEQVTEHVAKLYLLQPQSDYGKRAYEARGLAGRPALTIVEAGLKLIIERGTIDSCEGFVVHREFVDGDFTLGVYQGLQMFQGGPLQQGRQILWADEETGEIRQADGSVYECGRLLDLANGQALASTYPALDQRPSAAQKCLKFLDLILDLEMGKGDQVIKTNQYQVERQGQTITLKQQRGAGVLLQGEVERLQVEVSYLSSTDAQLISNEYQRVIHSKFEQIVDLPHAQTVVNPDGDIVCRILPEPLSVWDLDRSWSVPSGEIPPGPIDPPTVMAVVEAAHLIVEGSEGETYTGDGFVITQRAGDIEVHDLDGQLLVQRVGWELPGVAGLDSQTALQILRVAQDNQARLQQVITPIRVTSEVTYEDILFFINDVQVPTEQALSDVCSPRVAAHCLEIALELLRLGETQLTQAYCYEITSDQTRVYIHNLNNNQLLLQGNISDLSIIHNQITLAEVAEISNFLDVFGKTGDRQTEGVLG